MQGEILQDEIFSSQSIRGLLDSSEKFKQRWF